MMRRDMLQAVLFYMGFIGFYNTNSIKTDESRVSSAWLSKE